ncbi:MAG: preprotein translocase subunit SecA [Phycisphaerales bacterium]|nr:preprotein translocase subunit SecA [Phycisphaerales bacterium]
MAIPLVSPLARKLFGTRNDRLVKRYLSIVDEVSSHESVVRSLDDAQLRAKTEEFRTRIDEGASAESLIPEVFAVAREAMDRNVGIRNIFDPAQDFDPSSFDADIRAMYDETKAAMEAAEDHKPTGDCLGCMQGVPAWQVMDIPTPIYDAVRALYPQSRPPFRARPFDVQIIGGIVLYEGRIAEMKTGEGKTIVAPLACYLAALQRKQVHVVTVNDYLVQRDRDWTFPFFRSLGLTVGAIHPQHMLPPQLKQVMYHCDVVYGTTSEFGFDYLRDNMKMSKHEQVQKRRQVAIVDEVDSTLIDEARTPLIISGPAHDHEPRYELADTLARHLIERQKQWNVADEKVQSCQLAVSTLEGDIRNARDKAAIPQLKAKLDETRAKLPDLEAVRDEHTQFYEVELDKKRATLTHEGIAEAQTESGLGSFYVGENLDMPHLLEQAIRAHAVYQRDRDYIVAPDEQGQQTVVIVDQNTGRKMVGRQWSDGLHQAVEAKERVPIKQETQTMATITIQNFFKLYERLSGMTGTADTEATEFYEIYKLDVVVIPTNVPVERVDHQDVVYLTEKDKTAAILEEIRRFHDVGLPVLVGTTSVENSKMLSDELTRRHGVRHEVLNAEQHERESEIVKSAGQLGAVMVATNMAGRGTDIKLGEFDRNALVSHWKQRDLLPRDAGPSMDDEALIAAVFRHLAARDLKLPKAELEAMDDAAVEHAMLAHWYVELAWGKEGKAKGMTSEALRDALDKTGSTAMHRIRVFDHIEDMGGLHVVGTERHESRRIDNQLRGRSGRQGDNGSSRFFLSLEDPLMKMFAGPTTLRILSKLGMKEGDAIEHSMLTKAVGRAQRKVEERNFLIRKNILEYDEVMDHQRHDFYGTRQRVLEGDELRELIFDYLGTAVEDACWRFLDAGYRAACVTEWIREHLNVTIEPERLKFEDRDRLHESIRRAAAEEVGQMIRISIGEFIAEEIDLGTGSVTDGGANDWQGLVNWVNGHFGIDLKVEDIHDLPRDEIIRTVEARAEAATEAIELDGLDTFLVETYPHEELAKWVTTRFGQELDPSVFKDVQSPDEAVGVIIDEARDLYHKRERFYPIDFAIEMTTAGMQQDPAQAIAKFCAWVKARYELDWTPETLPSTNPMEIRQHVADEAITWDDAKVEDRARRLTDGVSSVDELDERLKEQLSASLFDDEREAAESDMHAATVAKIRSVMRLEVEQLERWVLLQILDAAWKEHLHQMDQLREAIGYRSFSQRDPRIEFKREGAKLYEDMQENVRDRLVDMVFKVRLSPQVQQQGGAQPGAQPAAPGAPAQQAPGPQQPPTQQDPAQAAVRAAAAAASGDASQSRSTSRSRQPASGGAGAALAVGRNEPCPCGSGKKYKKCCGVKK